ncbi:MAG TPA: GerMN domain-containing protein [Syntrophomonadaceae bacterium]|nr:GerMN domain-containing protein [Syntrophomonadaceae bacterium]
MKDHRIHLIIVILVLIPSLSLTGCDHAKNLEKEHLNQSTNYSSRVVVLYFGNESSLYLVPEKRHIRVPTNPSTKDMATAIIENLIAGPSNPALSPTFPPETKLREVQISRDLAIVDFSQELTSRHEGSITAEAMTIGSLVNSLTELEAIQEVQILIEGQRVDSLLGYWDTSRPIQRNEFLLNN